MLAAIDHSLLGGILEIVSETADSGKHRAGPGSTTHLTQRRGMSTIVADVAIWELESRRVASGKAVAIGPREGTFGSRGDGMLGDGMLLLLLVVKQSL